MGGVSFLNGLVVVLVSTDRQTREVLVTREIVLRQSDLLTHSLDFFQCLK